MIGSPQSRQTQMGNEFNHIKSCKRVTCTLIPRSRTLMANLRITVSQLIVCVLLGATGINGKPPKAIVGGSTADDNEFPYQVLLSVWNQAMCGGTIIGSRHILTAAHCVDEPNINLVKEMVVTTGTNDIKNDKGKKYRVKSIKSHPQYSKLQAWRNDIAVITLKTEIEFNSREQAANLPISDTPANVVATASGWGDVVYPKGDAPEKLKKLVMTTIANSKCVLPRTGKAQQTQLCALDKAGSGLCVGDSGGPLVEDGVIIGIASFVMRCALGYPDVFTRVYKYVDWINQVTERS